ncbi:MAG: GNAT family N-acetyltransferase [Bacillota bacterium]
MIRGEKTVIRAIVRADIPVLMNGLNDEDIMYRVGPHFPYPEAYWESFVENIARSEREKAFMICDKATNKPIGILQLTSIHIRNRTADIFTHIFDKGSIADESYEVDALRTMSGFLFEQLNYHRLTTFLHEDNERAVRVYSGVGYVKEALMLEENFRRGKFTNAWLMRLLVSEFRAKEASRT